MKTKFLALMVSLSFFLVFLTGFSGDTHKISDVMLETVSLERLKMDTRINADNITVKSEKHVVTLGGTVKTFEEMHMAEHIVSSTIVGVKGIINHIQVKTPPVGDVKLTADVRGRLEKEPGLEGGNIKVEVEKGIVRLSGTVKDYQQQSLAADVVSTVNGVNVVVIGLKIVPEKLPDSDIDKAVGTYLKFSPLVDASKIKFSVKNGVVHLSGQVDHLMQKHIVMEDIMNLRGVVYVESQLGL